MSWYGMVWYGTVRYGKVWFGKYGKLWYGMVSNFMEICKFENMLKSADFCKWLENEKLISI